MEMQFIKASNGKTYPYPADWSDERIYEDIKKKIKGPDSKENPVEATKRTEDLVKKDVENISKGQPPINTQMAQQPQSNGRMALDKFHDALRNLGAGAVESGYNAASAFKPSINENRPDMQKMFGVQNKNEAIQKIPEMAATFMPGGLAAKGLSKAPALVKALGAAAEQGVIQGGLGYLFNPESREESGVKAGGTAAATQLGINALTSSNPIARTLRYILPRAAGGYAAEKGGEFAGLPMPVRIALGAAGTLMGGGAASILPKILGSKSIAAKTYAQDIIDAGKNVRPREVQVAQKAAERRGVHLTPGELTQDPVLLAKESKAGVTKSNVRLKNSLEEQRKAVEAKVNEEFRSGVYNPAKHEKEKKAAFDVANMTKFPTNMIPKEHQHAYDLARKFAKTDKNLSIALGKSRKGTIGEQDVLRRALDDMTKDKKGSVEQLQSARDALSKSLKNYSKDYKTGMMYSEREHLANEIKDLSDKQKLSGKPFFKFIEGDQALKDAIMHTRDVPGSKQFLKDAKRIYSRRKDVDAEKLAKKLTESSIPTSKSEATTLLARMFDGKGDKDLIKMMYDPNLMKKVHSIAGMDDAENIITEFAKVLGRTGAQSVARTKGEGI